MTIKIEYLCPGCGREISKSAYQKEDEPVEIRLQCEKCEKSELVIFRGTITKHKH